MKKIFLICAIAMMVVGLSSCGNSKTTATEPAAEEQPATEAVTEPESEDVDAARVETRGESDSEGFGRCSASGCSCKAFEGRGDTCKNCGHAYRKHY